MKPAKLRRFPLREIQERPLLYTKMIADWVWLAHGIQGETRTVTLSYRVGELITWEAFSARRYPIWHRFVNWWLRAARLGELAAVRPSMLAVNGRYLFLEGVRTRDMGPSPTRLLADTEEADAWQFYGYQRAVSRRRWVRLAWDGDVPDVTPEDQDAGEATQWMF